MSLDEVSWIGGKELDLGLDFFIFINLSVYVSSD